MPLVVYTCHCQEALLLSAHARVRVGPSCTEVTVIEYYTVARAHKKYVHDIDSPST